MKQIKLLLLLLILSFNTPLLSQHQGLGDETPVLKEISGLQEVKKVMPTAIEIVQINDVWHKIVDKSNVLLGYCISSKPYSEGIKGYHGATPVIVILDKEKRIKKITMLSHYETLSYIEMLKHQKFFASWEGLTIRDAMNAKATSDSYSGATITAVAIRRNLDILFRKAYEKRV
jgi:Na+-translocating ferredoxin:NAD+ oxidoreductase RnfG subunit